jgi:hypothetical protein
MGQQHGQAVADFAAVAARHPFELLGDVFEVEGVDLAAPRVLRLVLEPGDEIFLVGRDVARRCHRGLQDGS